MLCSSAWTKDKYTGKPLLAVAGDSGVIKILDVIEGKVLRNLLGHGEVWHSNPSGNDANI